jgi:hypothetical protein
MRDASIVEIAVQTTRPKQSFFFSLVWIESKCLPSS